MTGISTNSPPSTVHRYFDRGGQGIDLATWGRLSDDTTYRWLITTRIDGALVRTIWDGIAGQPMFRTGISLDDGATWRTQATAEYECEAFATHTRVVNEHVIAEDPWMRRPHTDGTTTVDITRTRDGRVMCQLCFDLVRHNELDRCDGYLTDICRSCGTADRQETTAAKAYYLDHGGQYDDWRAAWRDASAQARARYRAYAATTAKDDRHA